MKGGKLKPENIRELVGTMQGANDADLGGFISLNEPSKQMKEAAAKAGTFTYRDVRYPRVQMLTIKRSLKGDKTSNRPQRSDQEFQPGKDRYH